jgi:uroporphyrinogen decarboxylase
LQELSRICKIHGLPTQIHCCGPEKELVRICAEETDINCMNPLEEPPMGDCLLKKIKQLYGHKLSLSGNIHTTRIMLHGSVEQVETACKKAIDDAAEGGGFILSTGDQCGRDTPHENIRTMIEIARSYGKYF